MTHHEVITQVTINEVKYVMTTNIHLIDSCQNRLEHEIHTSLIQEYKIRFYLRKDVKESSLNHQKKQHSKILA